MVDINYKFSSENQDNAFVLILIFIVFLGLAIGGMALTGWIAMGIAHGLGWSAATFWQGVLIVLGISLVGSLLRK